MFCKKWCVKLDCFSVISVSSHFSFTYFTKPNLKSGPDDCNRVTSSYKKPSCCWGTARRAVSWNLVKCCTNVRRIALEKACNREWPSRSFKVTNSGDLEWPWRSFPKVIPPLQAFSSAIRRTFAQHFNRFQLTALRDKLSPKWEWLRSRDCLKFWANKC